MILRIIWNQNNLLYNEKNLKYQFRPGHAIDLTECYYLLISKSIYYKIFDIIHWDVNIGSYDKYTFISLSLSTIF